MTEDIARLTVNTLRTLAMDAVQKADSGHPGTPMAVAPMAYVLWKRHLRHSPADPSWPDRDRFVLSMGHASMLLYSMLHLTGYDLDLEDLRRFRSWESRTPGHPEVGETPGVECTTGPLGQGFGMGVGMALAERFLAARYNTDSFPLFDHRVYAFCSDGDLMEGVSSEAASLAGHLGLGKLIYLYDDNRITIDGHTELAFSEDVAARFGAYGWHVQGPLDGTDTGAVDRALEAATEDEERPSLIICRTTIAPGSPNKEDTSDAHGAPLGEEEVRLTKENLGWPPDETFRVPEEVREHMDAAAEGRERQNAWQEMLERYMIEHPEKGEQLRRELAGGLPEGWERLFPSFEAGSKPMATRSASGKVLNALAPSVPNLVGGSADLAPSNKTLLEDSPDNSADHPEGRNIRFGVREHAMGTVCNGMALHGGVIPYAGTFLVFSDYMRPAIRMAALQRLPVHYVFTHDSIGLGEDGPTHQPVEQAMSLRLVPGLRVIRPADANETAAAWRLALEYREGPTALLLTRQGVPVLDPERAKGTLKGGYVLSRTSGSPEITLVATGSEVHLALEAKAILEGRTVPTQVVSLPCWEVFEEQDPAYREEVLPSGSLVVSIEAGASLGWERWTGKTPHVHAVDRFGASAPGEVVLREYGFTAEDVVERIQRLLED
ncbi:MAG: transketolase [bacterium]